MKGYFRKRGDKWSFTIDIGQDPETGNRKQKTKSGFKTKKEAQLAAAALIQELETGVYIEESNIVFKDFSEEWLKLYSNTGKVKESTVRVRKHEISALLPYFANLQLKKITKKNYQDALFSLKDVDGYAHNTLIGIHRTGKMIFNKAIELGVIKSDPTQYSTLPIALKTVEELENEVEIPKYLEKDELSLFLNTVKEFGKDFDYVAFLLLSYTGFRVGEMLALKWKDINFETGDVSITKTLYNPNNNIMEYKLLPPKTKSSKRIVDIAPIVLKELEQYKAFQNEFKMQNHKTYYDEDFIFIKFNKYHGYPEIIKTIELRMKKFLKKAKLNTALTPHSLRHTHTSLLAEAGVDLPQIMKRLGHTNDKTTKNIYLHVTKTMKNEAAQKFASLMETL